MLTVVSLWDMTCPVPVALLRAAVCCLSGIAVLWNTSLSAEECYELVVEEKMVPGRLLGGSQSPWAELCVVPAVGGKAASECLIEQLGADQTRGPLPRE